LKNTVEELRKIPFIHGLPDQAIAELAQQVQHRRLEKGQVLFRKGEPGASLYLIRSGWVKIVTENHEGGELVLNHCGPGEVVGEMSLIDQEPRSAGVVTLSPVEVLELKRETFMEVLSQQPLLALDVMRNFSARMRFATTYIEKAIEWSHRIAEGDYHFTLEEIVSESGVVDRTKADETRAAELLAAFFHMAEVVRDREETLKQQLQDLTIEIDEAKRRRSFEQVAQSDFFKDLRSTVRQMRQQPENDDDDQQPGERGNL
jgi:CRP-like cAMP-binding protein